jgi:hypothetical protein
LPQGVGPEFKTQFYKKKTKERKGKEGKEGRKEERKKERKERKKDEVHPWDAPHSQACKAMFLLPTWDSTKAAMQAH